MRLIHTSDWHLGQTLHGHDRGAEHAVFLDWLLDLLLARAADALLIAGDVFDQANPSAEAQRLYYRFLGQAVRRCPKLDIVVIAGNHDSPARIDAPHPVLQALGVHVVGLYRAPGAERVRVALHRPDGSVGAWVLALPFLRPADLPRTSAEAYGEGIAQVYSQAVAEALQVREPGQALLAMGHLHVLGGQLSEDSERRLLIGGQEAVHAGLFPPELAYVALGHLHLAQAIGHPRLRYCGSPLPLSFNEIGYPHQVVEVTLAGEQLAGVEAISVPRPASLLRIPARHRPLHEVLPLLAAIEAGDAPPGLEPLVEVLVERAWGEADPVPQVRLALEHKRVRLGPIRVVRALAAGASEEAPAARLSIEELQPAALFGRLVSERSGAPPDAQLWSAFGELLAQVQAEER